MKTAGIIAEYNPFHNGHLYQLNKLRDTYNCDHIISLMSGNFLQRGLPAVSNKYHRAKMAVISGVDAVIELPFVHATSSARDFAMAGVTFFNKLSGVDYLAFGAECDDAGLLNEIASIVTYETDVFSNTIKYYTSNGLSYPAARQKAIVSLCKEAANVISEPNNILAIEYLRALKETNSNIKPIIIKRKATPYNSTDINGNICSASAVRELLQNEDISYDRKKETLKKVLPEAASNEFLSVYNKIFPIYENDLTPFLQGSLLLKDGNYNDIYDMTCELSNKLKKAEICSDYTSICEALKTKEITRSHINRALIHLLLDVKNTDMAEFKENGIIFYAHVLSLKKTKSGIFKEIKNISSIPVFTKTADASELLDKTGNAMLEYDITATRLYNAAVYNKYKTALPDDYTVRIPVI